jgi:hypothetical protein
MPPAAISAVAYGRPYSVCTETALNLYRLAAGGNAQKIYPFEICPHLTVNIIESR